MRAPAFYLAMAFASGIGICATIGAESIIPTALLTVALALIGLILPDGRSATIASLCAAVCAGFFICSCQERALRCADLRLLIADRQARLTVRGELMRSVSWQQRTGERGRSHYTGAALMKLLEVEMPGGWRPLDGRVRARFIVDRPVGLRCGDLLQATGELCRIRQATNPGQFDRRSFWHRRGVDYSLLVKGEAQVRCLQSGRRFAWRWVEKVRARLRRALEYGLPDCPERRIILAMILGYRENIGEEITMPFRKTNTLHILAISGLHVGFVYLIMKALLRAFAVPRHLSALTAIVLIAAYAVVSGLRVPVVRASVMFVCFLAAPLFGRQRRAVNSLGVAALVLLVVNPLQLFDAGFQLSFAAVLSILLLAEPIAALFMRVWPCAPLPGQLLVSRGERCRWLLAQKMILLFSVSIAAWLGLAPLIARMFHVVSPLGLLGNTIVIPAGFGIVCLGFSAAAASFLFPPLAGLLNRINYLVVFTMRSSIEAIGRIPYAWFFTASPGPLQFASYYGLIAVGALVLHRGGGRGTKVVVLLAAAVLVFLPISFLPERPMLTATFLDVWQGDSTYMEFPDGSNLLIDGGPEKGFPAGDIVLKPFLQSRGCSRIDTVVLTHPHLDHVSGLFTVLEEFSVGRFVVADWGDSSEPYRQILGLARESGAAMHTVSRGASIASGEGVSITVINPGNLPHRGTQSDLNNNSVALMVEYGEVRILICADMEREAEEQLCSIGMTLSADVLRTGHHGGGRSSTAEFLRRVSPQWAIISAGENNRFEHPSPEALGRLGVQGIRVLRTDLHGAVTLTTDGRDIEIETFR